MSYCIRQALSWARSRFMFYFFGEPALHMALGAFFSAAEVIPLTFLTLEAWSFPQLGIGPGIKIRYTLSSLLGGVICLSPQLASGIFLGRESSASPHQPANCFLLRDRNRSDRKPRSCFHDGGLWDVVCEYGALLPYRSHHCGEALVG